MCWRGHVRIGISASIWTVVQTSIHIVWVLCGYYFYICKIKPTYYGLVILYLTYFYKDECGNVTLKCNEILVSGLQTMVPQKIHVDDDNKTEDEEDVYDIIQIILDKGVLPKESNAAYRTHVYFYAFIVSDAAWIVSSFLLFAGTCFQIKKMPVPALLLPLDNSNSLRNHLGRRFFCTFRTGHLKNSGKHTTNLTSWLKFIGVQNYQDFTEFNDHSSASIIPLIPVVSLCILFSRALVLWIWNIVLFVQVLNAAVLAFQGVLKRAKGNEVDPNLDTSSSRIRNWQLFYGAIESSTSSSSSKSSESHPNTTMKRTSTRVQIKEVRPPESPPHSLDSAEDSRSYIASIRDKSQELNRNKSNVSTYYHKYTDVAESFDNTFGRGMNNRGLDSFNNQHTSWSYYKPTDEDNGTELTYIKSGVGLDDCGLPAVGSLGRRRLR
ncbi:hypothetical protein NQ315_006417, partial [Exocentrus adspersus]